MRMGKAMEELFKRHPRLECCRDGVVAALAVLVAAFRNDGKVLACGNGGSAADAEHICGELLKKFRKHRPVQPEIAIFCVSPPESRFAPRFKRGVRASAPVRCAMRASSVPFSRRSRRS